MSVTAAETFDWLEDRPGWDHITCGADPGEQVFRFGGPHGEELCFDFRPGRDKPFRAKRVAERVAAKEGAPSEKVMGELQAYAKSGGAP